MAWERGGGKTHLVPSNFSREDIRTMGTREPMVYFAMLGEDQRVYLDRTCNNHQGTNLIQETLCGEIFETAGTFEPVIGIIMLRWR